MTIKPRLRKRIASEAKKSEDEKSEIIAACDKLMAELDGKNAETVLPDDCGDVVSEKKPTEEEMVCAECNELEAKIASILKPGVEDKIKDNAKGGDPSVSEVRKNSVKCESDKEVFGKNSKCEYIASITSRLDRIADSLESHGHRAIAFRIDQLSDRLEASVR